MEPTRWTPEQQKRLAREARRLASEICEGRAPVLDDCSWGECALAHVVMRSGVRIPSNYSLWSSEPRATTMALDEWLAEPDVALSLVSLGLSRQGPDGAVFPLLWAADELDAASEQPPAGPSASASLAGQEQDKEET